MKYGTIRFRHVVGALVLFAAPWAALAAIEQNRSAAVDQPPQAANPDLGAEDPELQALARRALRQPSGQREPGTALRRPRVANPQR